MEIGNRESGPGSGGAPPGLGWAGLGWARLQLHPPGSPRAALDSSNMAPPRVAGLKGSQHHPKVWHSMAQRGTAELRRWTALYPPLPAPRAGPSRKVIETLRIGLRLSLRHLEHSSGNPALGKLSGTIRRLCPWACEGGGPVGDSAPPSDQREGPGEEEAAAPKCLLTSSDRFPPSGRRIRSREWLSSPCQETWLLDWAGRKIPHDSSLFRSTLPTLRICRKAKS